MKTMVTAKILVGIQTLYSRCNLSEDILEDWKRNRFILASKDLTETENHLIILTDIKYWSEHADDLVEWCNKNPRAHPQGMTVEISDDKTLTHFILKWS
jgi:hypothetical protein